ncbi:kazrin isoform X6 [Prionailurus iriomotensis]
MDSALAPAGSATGPVTFSHVFGQQCQLMEAAVQSLYTLNDQISHFIVTKSKALEEDKDPFLPTEKETLKSSMILMRHLLMDAQAKILSMMEDNKQLALRIDGAVQSASQEVTNLRAELTATNRRLAELSGGGGGPGPGPGAAASASAAAAAAAADSAAANMENHQHGAQGRDPSNIKEIAKSGPFFCEESETG